MKSESDSTRIPKGRFEVEMLEAVAAAGHVVTGFFLGVSVSVNYPRNPAPEIMSVRVSFPGVFDRDAETVTELVRKGEQQRAIQMCRMYGLLQMSGEAARQRFGPKDEDWEYGEYELWKSELLDPALEQVLTAKVWDLAYPELQSPVARCLRLNRLVHPKAGYSVSPEAEDLFFEECHLADEFIADSKVWAAVKPLARRLMSKTASDLKPNEPVEIGVQAWQHLQQLRSSKKWTDLLGPPELFLGQLR